MTEDPKMVAAVARAMMDHRGIPEADRTVGMLAVFFRDAEAAITAMQPYLAAAHAAGREEMREEAAGHADDAWASHNSREDWDNPNRLCHFIAGRIRSIPITKEPA